jgi:hypothetical protein
MEMQAVKVDTKKIEAGAWIGDIPDMGDLRLQVRGAGNADWRRLQARLVAAVPRAKRTGGRLDPVEADKITSVLLRDAGLTGWENLTDAGVVVPYSKEAAEKYLTQTEFRAFRDAVLWACTEIGQQSEEQIEEDVKN